MYDGSNYTPGVLMNALYVPELKVNLFSVVSALDKGYTWVSNTDTCKFLKNGQVVSVAKREGSSFIMKLKIKRHANALIASNLKTWHQRLAHQNFDYVKDLLNKNKIKYSEERIVQCVDCIKGKQSRFQFNNSSSRVNKPGELFHMDLCGPMEEESLGNSRYFLLIKDDYSSYRYVYFLKQKWETKQKIEGFLKQFENEFDVKVKRIRSDNGTEFINKQVENMLIEKGIIHEKSVVYTPEQNGRIEREMRTIVEAARTMLQAKGLQKSLWAEAVNTAVFVINRTGKSKIEGKTPFEVLYNKEFDITNLHVFGDVAYTHIPKEKRKKWDAKSQKGIFVGYEFHTKGYRVWNPNTKDVGIHRDIVFECETDNDDRFEDSLEEIIDDDRARELTEERSDDILIQQEEIHTNQAFNDENGCDIIQREETGNSRDSHEETFYEANDSATDIENTVEPTAENEIIEPQRIRTRTRLVRRPQRFDDYHTFTAKEDDEITYKMAMEREDADQWKDAIERELQALEFNNTWTESTLPIDKKIIEGKWVFKIKKGEDGQETYKARLVARGFQQEDEFDSSEIYAPVAKLPTLRILLAIANRYKLNLLQMDVKSAFLYGDIHEDVYIKIPQGIERYNNKVLKLNKSLYGLKKSPRNWNDKFDSFMAKQSFVRSKSDYCLYYKEGKRFYVLVYVDDIMIFGENEEWIEKFKQALEADFRMTELGKDNLKYLGIHINRKEDIIEIDQKQFLEELLRKYKMQDCNAVSTPIESGTDLKKGKTEDESLESRCRALIGSLMYASLGTRPDLCYAISYLSRFQAYPSEQLWNALKRVLRYIKGTLDYKLVFNRGVEELIAYTDADWAGDQDDRKSTSGCILKVYGCTVSWCSVKQQCVALSSTESEYVALGKGITEGCWIRNLLRELGLGCDSFKVYVDNQSAIHVAKNPEHHKRLKHIDLKMHFVRDKVSKGIVSLIYINSRNQLADVCTKPLNRGIFEEICLSLNLIQTK